MIETLLKKKAARLLRTKIGIPARKISKTMKKSKIVEELRNCGIIIKIK